MASKVGIALNKILETKITEVKNSKLQSNIDDDKMQPSSSTEQS